MNLSLAATVFGCCTLVGCAATEPTQRGVVGSFRYGFDPDNAEYLVLSRNGSFQYGEVSTEAVGQTVAPHLESRRTGTWVFGNREVVLNPTATGGRTHLVRRYAVNFRGNKPQLRPVYGAGYISASGFLPVPATEATRHLSLNFATLR